MNAASFQALRGSMSGQLENGKFLIPFCQLKAFQTGDLSGHLLLAFRRRLIFAVLLRQLWAVIRHRLRIRGRRQPRENAFSQFSGLPDEIQACAACVAFGG